MICSQISIFEPLKTIFPFGTTLLPRLWFALKLVSLNHWKQFYKDGYYMRWELWFALKLVSLNHWKQFYKDGYYMRWELWFALKLVSLNHWKQCSTSSLPSASVVICSQISIFEPLKTICLRRYIQIVGLWFALKLVSLNHWKQSAPFGFLYPSGCDLLSN